MPVVYLDVLLALNLFIDFLLLLATARLLRLPYRRWRLVLGALAGAASACLIFLPALSPLAAAGLKLLAAGIFLLIAFAWQGVWTYIKTLTVFFVCSTLFAGIAGALWFFAAPQGFYVANGVVYYDVPPLMLVFLTVVSYGALCLFDRFVRKKAPVNREYRLLVTCGGETVSVKALYDSGNSLTEPFSGSPVAVVNRAALEGILPEEVRAALRPGASPPGSGGTAAALRVRLRMIPFRSVGGGGLLPAFQPDRLTVVAAGGESRDVTGGYVALGDAIGQGEFDALIGTDMAERFAASEKTTRPGPRVPADRAEE